MSRTLDIEHFEEFGFQVVAESPPDGELLRRFLAHRDQEAFEAIVLKHGPKVLRLCRRWLGHGQDADDAFQATFLILIDRAGEIRSAENVGGWLLGVARNVASRARLQAERRQARERATLEIDEIEGADRSMTSGDDLHPVVRAEVDKLPEKYRRAIELCYWEGLSSEEAARRLQCPTGTIKWRLSRAREILRSRLSRIVAALAVLLFWRLPSASAGEIGRSTAGLLQAKRLGGYSDGDDDLPDWLVKQTSKLASYSRDRPNLFSKLTESRKPRRARPRPAWIAWTLLGAAILTLAAMPSVRQFGSGLYASTIAPESPPSCH